MTILSIILAFLAAHWLDILVGAIVITALVILWRKGHKKLVIRVIKALVAKAEQQYGCKTGQIKFEAVWSEIYAHIPWIVRIFFSEKELAGYIKDAVKWLTKLITDNPDINLLTYAEEQLKKENKAK
jgi:hypothetical protein